jgi:hypothetical protein
LRSGTQNCQNDAASDVTIVYLQEAVTPASLAAKTKGGIAISAAPIVRLDSVENSTRWPATP